MMGFFAGILLILFGFRGTIKKRCATMILRAQAFIIPLINEVFGENFTDGAKVEIRKQQAHSHADRWASEPARDGCLSEALRRDWQTGREMLPH